jgi:hypothetical protein
MGMDVRQGETLTFSVAVNCSSADPTGDVVFNDNQQKIGSVPVKSGIASIDRKMSAGSHTIRAAYSGDARCAASNAVLDVVASASYLTTMDFGEHIANFGDANVLFYVSVRDSGMIFDVESGAVTVRVYSDIARTMQVGSDATANVVLNVANPNYTNPGLAPGTYYTRAIYSDPTYFWAGSSGDSTLIIYPVPTATATATATTTSAASPTFTPDPTATRTTSPTFTPDPTATHTATVTSTSTHTATVTLTPSRTNTPLPPTQDTVGVFKGGIWYLRLSNTTGIADLTSAFGLPSDLPVVGDWNNNGFDTIGLYRSAEGRFILSDSNTAPAMDYDFSFGNPGDVPFAGKWDAMTTGSSVGVYRTSNGVLYLKRVKTTGFSDYAMIFGNPGDSGVAGDWNGDGFDNVGVYRTTTTQWFMINTNANGIVNSDIDFVWGTGAHSIVVGDWDGNGTSTPGYLTNTGNFVLHPANVAAGVDSVFPFGPVNSLPVAGKWTTFASPPSLGIIQPVLGAVSADSDQVD